MDLIPVVHISIELWNVILCLACALFCRFQPDGKSPRFQALMLLILSMAFQLATDAVAWAFRGDPSVLGFWMVRLGNGLYFASNYLCMLAAFRYAQVMLQESGVEIGAVWRRAVYGTCGVALAVILLSQFTGLLYTFDETNHYHRAPGFFLQIILALGVMVLLLAMIIHYRDGFQKPDFINLSVALVLMVSAGFTQSLFYGISIINLGLSLVMVLLFFSHELMISRQKLEQEQELLRYQAALAQQQHEQTRNWMHLVTAQIQSHFISNTLIMIQAMYHEAPKAADGVMNDFIGYLQYSFQDVSAATLLPIQREVTHARRYTDIQEERWPDIEFLYEVAPVDFVLPVLTIQPLVENAILHGILPKGSGGIVTVRVWQQDGMNCVAVEDDGVGFHPEDPDNQRSQTRHLGMENVRSRVETLCRGTLTVEPLPQGGTRVLVQIPADR